MWQIKQSICIFLAFILILVQKAVKCYPSKPNIFGGQEAKPGDFPFIVSFQNTDYPGYTFCGGSILNEEWIVTAGHCVADYFNGIPDNLIIVAGNIDLSKDIKLLKPIQIIVHPDYNENVAEDDIALVKLEDKLTLSDEIQKIELGNANGNDSCTVAGWGTSDIDMYPIKLRYLETIALTVEDCTNKWQSVPSEYSKYYTGEKKICTLTKAGQGNCFGDSGGPLISNGKLVGLVSAGVPCAQGFPDLNTRTSSYIDWINDVIAFNSNGQ